MYYSYNHINTHKIFFFNFEKKNLTDLHDYDMNEIWEICIKTKSPSPL